MELTRGSFVVVVTAVVFILATAFPSALAQSPTAAPAPSTSDGTTIDQGIAYVLMLVALLLTYLMH